MNKFYQDVEKELKAIVGDNGEVVVQEVRKNNGTVLHGVSIKYPQDTKVLPVAYMEDCKGNPHEAAVEIIDAIREAMENCPIVADVNVTKFTSFEEVRDKIIPRLVNAEANKEMLADIANTPFFDLAIVYTVVLGSDSNGQYLYKISKEILKKWRLSVEEIHQIAMQNLKSLPAKTFSLSEMFPSEMFSGDPLPLYVLTNEQSVNGAAMVLNENTLEKYLDMFGTNKLSIIPSSIHEVIITAATDAVDIDEMVKEVNSSTVSPEEVLSDHQYFYTREKGLYC